METLKHIWPKVRDMADDLGLPYTTVHSWIVRGRVPADYDLRLIEAAQRRGSILTLDHLARARAEQSRGAA